MTLGWPWPIWLQDQIWSFWMGKAKIVHISVAIIVCDVEMQSTSNPKNAEHNG